MEKITVLFACVHNSARSQMAEAFLKHLGGDRYQVESAGMEPGTLNPVAIDVMKEVGIDISNNKTKSIFELYIKDKLFQYVIAVCDESVLEHCPILPGFAKRLSWSIEDPSSLTGSYEEKLAKTRLIRDKIKDYVQDFITKTSEPTLQNQ